MHQPLSTYWFLPPISPYAKSRQINASPICNWVNNEIFNTLSSLQPLTTSRPSTSGRFWRHMIPGIRSLLTPVACSSSTDCYTLAYWPLPSASGIWKLPIASDVGFPQIVLWRSRAVLCCVRASTEVNGDDFPGGRSSYGSVNSSPSTPTPRTTYPHLTQPHERASPH